MRFVPLIPGPVASPSSGTVANRDFWGNRIGTRPRRQVGITARQLVWRNLFGTVSNRWNFPATDQASWYANTGGVTVGFAQYMSCNLVQQRGGGDAPIAPPTSAQTAWPAMAVTFTAPNFIHCTTMGSAPADPIIAWYAAFTGPRRRGKANHQGYLRDFLRVGNPTIPTTTILVPWIPAGDSIQYAHFSFINAVGLPSYQVVPWYAA